jgi:hypothetical protein
VDLCVASGCRVDFIPVYDDTLRSTAQYIERFQAVYERYCVPIWVTGYNYGNSNIGSADLDVETGYAKILAMTNAFDTCSFIERYNWYFFFESSWGIGVYDSTGNLNITGQFYFDLESSASSYTQKGYEDGPYLEVDFLAQITSLASEVSVNVYPNPVIDCLFCC